MIKSVVVDDEEKNREALTKMLSGFCPDVEVVDKVDSVKSAKDAIDKHKPDLVFLDIELKGEDGFTLLEEIGSPDFQVIFTTAHSSYAIKAIRFAALDYLLKPINVNELKEAVAKVGSQMNDTGGAENNHEKISVLKENRLVSGKEDRRIALPTSDGVYFVNLRNVLHCEADRSYCRFYLENGDKIMVSKPLKEYEELLEEFDFMRVHKSHMVNLRHVVRYIKGAGGYVVMRDGSEIEVSSRKKSELIGFISQMNN